LSNIIRKNLVVETNSFYGCLACLGPNCLPGPCSIVIANATIAENNYIAGLTFIFAGDACPYGDQFPNIPFNITSSIKNNQVHGSPIGVAIDPMHPKNDYLNCLRISGFTVYKSSMFAILYKTIPEVLIDNNIVIDSQVGMYAYIFEQPSLTHIVGNKTAQIENNLIIGQSQTYTCADDFMITINPGNYRYFGAGLKFDAKIGVVWSTFSGGFDTLWDEGWGDLTTYNSLGGLTVMNNNTFAHFDTNCKGSQDACISSSHHNEDFQHPINIKNSDLFFVNNNSKVWIHRPNTSTINPSECIDMNCDGLKKNLLTDLDGSFLGSPGSVISQSEWGWGNQQMGIYNINNINLDFYIKINKSN